MIIVRRGEKEYPKMLNNIKNAPSELFIKGDTKCINSPCITVVGSRNMSDYGRNMTQKIVRELALAGVTIVSGLAIGIDSVAHKECLDCGGKTIAVLGSGLNKVYPSENIELFNRIISNGGCVISEQEPDVEANKLFFPARNRIVSGLSLATLVIEATYRSGTSITAKFAFEQGRKVFCLPNSIGNKNSSGTLNLIKKGATMITDGKEILYDLGLIDKLEDYDDYLEQQKINKLNMIEKETVEPLDEETKKIYNFIKNNKITNIEIMCNKLNLNIQQVNIHLSILELKGLINDKGGGNYTLRDEWNI